MVCRRGDLGELDLPALEHCSDQSQAWWPLCVGALKGLLGASTEAKFGHQELNRLTDTEQRKLSKIL